MLAILSVGMTNVLKKNVGVQGIISPFPTTSWELDVHLWVHNILMLIQFQHIPSCHYICHIALRNMRLSATEMCK